METNSSSEAPPELGSPLSIEPLKKEDASRRRNIARNLIGYWILGLCNNYGYVVMLSAAHDILKHHEGGGESPPTNGTGTGRVCNHMSTGAILLADIIPALFIKLVAPFLPFCIFLRVGTSVALSVAGFLLVALADNEVLAISGVVATSLASGLGEVTFLSYTTYFKEKVVSTWSSGTGGAGVIGSFSYAGLTSLGLDPSTSILIMLFVPALEMFTFIFLLKHPGKISMCNEPNQEELRSIMHSASSQPDIPVSNIKISVMDKIKTIPSLLKYMIPLGLVYLFEYFINQGMFELIYFPNIWLDRSEQYRWLQVDYQIGVFISRSSLHLVQINNLWIMAVLQAVNVIFFTFEAIYLFSPSIWIVFAAVLWEGLLGGASYVNTYNRISNEAPPEKREYSVGITCMSDSFGIALAGLLAIPAHNEICALPFY